MKLIYFSIAIAVMTIMSCTSSRSTASAAQIETLNRIVANAQYSIKSDWAYPQVTNAVQQVFNSGLLPPGSTAGAINLTGNYNHLTLSGDSISSYLPYFGERQMQIDYSSGDSAIEFEGIIENYNAVKNRDSSYTITFNAKSKSERFNVTLRLTPSLKSEITLTGASRFPIRYSGIVTEQTLE